MEECYLQKEKVGALKDIRGVYGTRVWKEIRKERETIFSLGNSRRLHF